MDRSVVKRVWEVTEPLITHEGLEIVDIDYQLEGRGMMLRFYLDRAEGGVTLDDLAPLSRRIGDVLDVHDVIPARYVLEVSSPGINRRLRRPDHFRRYIGQRVRVRTVMPLEGRKSFVGDLQSVADDGIVVATAENAQFIAFDDIARANYEHRF